MFLNHCKSFDLVSKDVYIMALYNAEITTTTYTLCGAYIAVLVCLSYSRGKFFDVYFPSVRLNITQFS